MHWPSQITFFTYHRSTKVNLINDARCIFEVPFLDVLVQRHRDGKINTSVYRKSSNSDIVLHYSSNHPPSHKRLCVKTLFNRAQLYCSDRTTLALEHSYLLNMFRNCGYPLPFIRLSMRRKIPRGHGQRGNLTPEVPSEDQRTSQESEPRWATLPYINGISETLARHLRSHNIKVAHKLTATLRTTLVKAKDTIPLETKAGLIYQFPCKGCNAKYVEETGKTLKTTEGHKPAVRNRYMSYLTAVHSLDTDEVQIIGPNQSRQAIHEGYLFR